MFGLGFGEIILIGLLALLLFGDKDLPANLKKMVGWVNSAKETKNEMQRTFYQMKEDVSKQLLTLDVESVNEAEKPSIKVADHVISRENLQAPITPAEVVEQNIPLEENRNLQSKNENP